MSGLEVAGLVLGSLPLLISALEHYAEGVGTIKRMIRYKGEVKILQRELKVEYDLFCNTLEQLLDGIVASPGPFLDDPFGHLWKDADFDKKLQGRLRVSYAGYRATVEDMMDAINEFKSRLGLDEHGNVPWTESRSLRTAFKKARFSLSRSEYQDLMQSIEKHNAKLAQLTTSSKELEPFRRRRKPLTNLRYLKDLAKSLFEALQKGLKSGHSPNANLHLASEQSLIGNAIAEEEVLRKVQFRVIVSYKGHSPQDRVPIWEDIDVRLLEAAKVATVISKPVPQKGVKFALAPACAAPLTATTANAQSFQATQQLQEIFDLCAAIQKRVLQQQACLGWLKDDRDRRHALYPRGAVLKQCAAKSLHEVLPGAHGTAALSRGNRLRLAVNISKSVLQLYRTPWLLSQWTTHDIRFIQTGKEPSYEDAFICRDLSSSHSQPTSTKKAPFIRNETLFALGILLIELCFGRFIEDFRTADDFTGTDYMSRMLTMYTIASRLLEQRKVFKEAGARYEYAVHRCIHCSFNHLTADLDDDEFCEAVYDEVVRRLEEDLQNFSGSIDMETDLGNS